MIPKRALLAAAGVLGLAMALPSHAPAAFITYNIAGTWTGSIKCSGVRGGVKVKSKRQKITMTISQLDLNVGIAVQNGNATTRYAGLLNPDKKKPEQKGEFAVVACGTNSTAADLTADELGRMQASTKPGKVKATIKGITYYSAAGNAPPEAGSCKWSWKRTDNLDPQLQTDCTTPIMALPAGVRP